MLLYGALSHALRLKEFNKSWWLTVEHQKFNALYRNDLGGAGDYKLYHWHLRLLIHHTKAHLLSPASYTCKVGSL
jgi:hypothetical protein